MREINKKCIIINYSLSIVEIIGKGKWSVLGSHQMLPMLGLASV
jgi:hypothetical protein